MRARQGCAFLRTRSNGGRSTCKARASYRVGVTLRERKTGQPVTIYVKLVCCASCGRKLTKEDVLTLAGFRKMSAFVFSEHRISPKWGQTTVELLPL